MLKVNDTLFCINDYRQNSVIYCNRGKMLRVKDPKCLYTILGIDVIILNDIPNSGINYIFCLDRKDINEKHRIEYFWDYFMSCKLNNAKSRARQMLNLNGE